MCAIVLVPNNFSSLNCKKNDNVFNINIDGTCFALLLGGPRAFIESESVIRAQAFILSLSHFPESVLLALILRGLQFNHRNYFCR